jgi:glucosylceramidase
MHIAFLLRVCRAGKKRLICASAVLMFVSGCKGGASSSPPPPPPAASPSFLPVPGTYTWTQTVALADATAGATIYFTTDGTTPTTASTGYTGPIPVSSSLTIKAIATAVGFTTSAVASAAYTITPLPATPAFTPLPGTYNSSQDVALADSTAGATIYYTTDGSTPTTSSAQYSGPVPVSSNMTIKAIAVGAGSAQSALATGQYFIVPATATGPAVSIVLTTDDRSNLMAPQSGLNFSAASGNGGNIVYVDENQLYQQVEGFGAAFTDSAAYLLNEVALPSARNALNDLFTRDGNGIGLSFMRNPMGASDLARSVYSFDDLPAGQTDPSLNSFSIAHDQADIIPLILQAKQLNPQLEIVANPWSPPEWMKDSGSMIGGSLLAGMYDPFAGYFVKYIQGYAAAGIPIDYTSLQNEPLLVPADYPGMCLPAFVSEPNACSSSTDEITASRDHVLPALTSNHIASKVLVWDFDWDRPDYPDAVLTDPAILSSSQVAGIAWHGYGGTPGVMTPLHNKYPAMGNYVTEHSGGTWVSDQIRSDFEEITQVLRNWGRAYVKWSLALDENRGPHTGGCSTCNPLVTVNSLSGAVTYDVEYYTLGHFSKYVRAGAQRIYSSNADGIVSVAFVNPAPDSSRVLVTYNDSNGAKSFTVQWGTQSFSYTLPALGGATFTWTGTQNGGYTVSAKSQIQASSFSSTSGLQIPSDLQSWGLRTEVTTDTDGGYDVGFADDGDYAVYKSIDFGAGVMTVSARLACNQNQGGNCNGALEFRLDGVSGPLVASVTIPATGDWQAFITAQATATGATGVHDLYVVFKSPASGTTNLGNLNWFQFN